MIRGRRDRVEATMTDVQRIQSFGDFWPATWRTRHPVVDAFCGKAAFCVAVWAVAANPARMMACLLAGLIVGFLARRIEANRRAGREALAIATLWLIGSPWIGAGILWAYLWAWVAHFKVELNRPATFQYPLWSLFGDFKMVSLMLRGQLWTGEPSHKLSPPIAHLLCTCGSIGPWEKRCV